ncbi:MAG: beta-galactosidase [Chthoniobacteraceae bacterium]
MNFTPFPALCLSLLLIGNLTAAEPAPRPWTKYRTIMWIGDTAYKKPEKLPLFFQRLREMGITTGMVTGDADAQPLLDAKLPFYVENIVNKGLCLKWSSTVRDWDKMVSAWKDGRAESGLVRDYSLDDPQWRESARSAMKSAVRKHAANHPLAYDIRDELSTTISANPFDYDFSPTALAGFRDWLKTQYADLAALNAEWETRFAKWDDVKPFTTDQIKNRMAGGEPDALGFPRGKPDWQAVQQIKFDPAEARKNPARWNFAPWCDHRTYMDVSLARTLGDLRETARAHDPQTPVGIEGTQMPSAFGGYDLWRLSQVLDWVEPYDVGNAREIFGSFMPGKTFLTTVGEQDAKAARRRLWHLLLEGDKGCLVWWSEDCIDWKSDDYALTRRAKALAPVLTEMQSSLARLFLQAEREYDPIAIHYSQASIQVDWLLESTGDGSTWLRRFSSYEAEHNRMLQLRGGWLGLLKDLGFSPRFVSSAQIEAGALKDFRVVVLPQSWAVSQTELKELKRFRERLPRTIADRTTILCDGDLGFFDEHGAMHHDASWSFGLNWHPLPGQLYELRNGITGPADALEGKPLKGSIADYSRGRSQAKSAASPLAQSIRELLKQVPLDVETPAEAFVATRRYRLGAASLLAFERNIVWQMSEDLKQAGGNEALETPVTFDAKFAAPGHVYDLRSGKYLGLLKSIPVDLDPWQPSLYALTKTKLPDGDVLAELDKLAPR